MIDYPWYGLADGDDLQQGDLLFACPFDRVDALGEADRKNFNVVIMSHSCDLAHDKLDMIQVCPFWDLERLASDVEFFRGKRGREELRAICRVTICSIAVNCRRSKPISW